MRRHQYTPCQSSFINEFNLHTMTKGHAHDDFSHQPDGVCMRRGVMHARSRIDDLGNRYADRLISAPINAGYISEDVHINDPQPP